MTSASKKVENLSQAPAAILVVTGDRTEDRGPGLGVRRAGLNQRGCQVVFVVDSEDRHLPEIFNSLISSSAPIVGESPEFAERGGGIQFYIDEGRIRFSINVDAVRRARLTVSSKLLALARIVHDKNHSSED